MDLCSKDYPLVSVCVPTFNGEKYIEEAILSITEQSYPSLEIIVSDDRSQDRTIEIINNLLSKTNIPFSLIEHEPIGIGANWNNSVKHANGKYIKFVFQDDIIDPDCILEMVTLAEKDSKIGLVFANRELLQEGNNPKEWINMISNLSRNWDKLTEIQNGKDLLKQTCFLNSPSNKIGEPSAVLIRRECFKLVGYFSEELKQSLDYEYWYRLMAFYKVGFVNKNLAGFRIHSQQASSLNAQESNISESIIYYKSVKRNLFKYLSLQNRLKLLFMIRKFSLKLWIRKNPLTKGLLVKIHDLTN